VDLPRMYDLLHYTHRQHHSIVQALENKEGARVAALMFEHACAIRESINMSRAMSRVTAENSDPPAVEKVNP
jgi:GntR family transcriptional regulator, vanillate catabolism transcriptional regulator